MRQSSTRVLDEFLAGSGPFRTADHYNDPLGKCDQLSIQAVVDNVDATGTITVQVEHSADNMNFMAKGAPAINAVTINTGVTNTCAGVDTGTSPSLRFVRLAITLATTTKAHVKLYVTMRDQGVERTASTSEHAAHRSGVEKSPAHGHPQRHTTGHHPQPKHHGHQD
jgi:hypothetical protein